MSACSGREIGPGRNRASWGKFLNPVQRARLLLMRRQLMDRVDQIRRGAGMGVGAGMGPGMQPMMRPGMMPGARRDSQPEDDQ